MQITFGLSWKHPAVILNGIAILISVCYVVVMTLVLHVPDGIHPYYKAVGGVITFAGLALWNIAEFKKSNTVMGYFLTGVNLFASFFLILIAVSHVTGPDSVLWHMLNSRH
jgi:hypothetical protein